MKPSRYLLPAATAFLAGAGGVLLAGPAVISPFVYPGVLAAHLLAALPLAAILAGYVPVRRAWAIASLAVAGFTATVGMAAGPWLEENDAGFVVRALLRTIWCVGLALPWFIALGPLPRPRPRELAIAGAVALILPGVYAERVSDFRVRELAQVRGRNETAKAARLADDLYNLGRETVSDSAGNKPEAMKDLRARLRREVQYLTRDVKDPLPATAPDRAVNARGIALARLDRLGEAEAVLRQVADRDADAEISLATVLQGAVRYEESSEYYRRAIDRAKPVVRSALAVPGTPTTPALIAAANRLRRGYEGLAYNARMRRAYDEGAGYYQEAMREFPGGEAYYHFQLGLHYAWADRPNDAVRHFDTATRLAPTEFGPAAAKHLSLLRRDTPACFLNPN